MAIPAFDAAPYLEAAIRSVLAQSLAAIEIIVVDDCSTDATFDIATRLQAEDSRVRVDRLARNGGPAAARNRALALARGKWLAIVDSDDLVAAPRMAMLAAIGDRVGADIIADNLVVFGDGETPRLFLDAATPEGWIELGDYLDRTVIYRDGANLGYLKPLLRIEALRAAGLCYDERLRIAEDDDFIVRALLAGLRYWFDPTPGYGYRRHPGSTSHRLSAANAATMLAAGERQSALGHDQPPPVQAALARRLAGFRKARAFAAFIAALKQHRPAAAARELLGEPAIIGLLHLPAGAALRRLRPNWLPQAKPAQDPAADAALAALLPAGDGR